MAFTGVGGTIERTASSWLERVLSWVDYRDPFAGLSKEEFDAYAILIAAHL